jgi:hypothetical protein
MSESPCSSRSGSPCLALGRESPDSGPASRPPARPPARRKQPVQEAAQPGATESKAAKQPKQSHEASPLAGPSQPSELPPELPPELPQDVGAPGRLPVPADVPERPLDPRTNQLVSAQPGIGPDEAYSKDEDALNTFLKLHPMLR